jgi:hypothetical protein
MNLIPMARAGQSVEATAGATVEMSVAEQNALVRRYCAVCHDDASRNGGLSLQHFDASQVEPSLAAMMLSKVKSGAIGASGQQLPDKPTQAAFAAALTAKSVGAGEWTISRTPSEGTEGSLMTASILREVPATSELYRLKLTCQPQTRQAAVQLSWSPTPGKSGRTISVEADAATPVQYLIEGSESMGNGMRRPDGTDVTSGPAAITLYATPSLSNAPQLSMPLPARELRIRELFPNETVVFPFEGLTPVMRRELAACFSEAMDNF